MSVYMGVNAFDGQNLAPVDMVSISWFIDIYRELAHPKWFYIDFCLSTDISIYQVILGDGKPQVTWGTLHNT